MIPAFAYLRVSGLTQTNEDKGGFPRQLEAITRYAAEHGYEIARIYEEGMSGKTDLENRPALSKLLSELGHIKVVIIEKVDRLARFLMVQESIIADFQRRGVTVLSSCEPDLCSDDPTRVLMRQILGAFAQYERSIIINRLQAGAKRARANGKKWGGQKRYGQHPKHPTETNIVQKVLDLNIQGLTLTAIAQELNREGFSTRSGGKWYPMHVSRILNQETTDATN